MNNESVEAPEASGFVQISEYLKLGNEDQVYLVEPLLPHGGTAVLFAKEKAGKSALAIQLMHALAGGADEWLGFPIKQHGRVLYLQVDNPQSTWVERFRILKDCGWNFCNDRVWIADAETIGTPALDLMNPDHEELLRKMVEDVSATPVPKGADYPPEPILVFLDTMRRVSSIDENSSADQQLVLNVVKRVAHPAAAILVAHQRKDQQGSSDTDIRAAVRGSGAVGGAVDVLFWLRSNKSSASLTLLGRNTSDQDSRVNLKKVVLHAPEDEDKKHGCIIWEVAQGKGAKVDEDVVKLVQDESLLTKGAVVKALMKLRGLKRTACYNRVNRFLAKHQAEVRESRPELLED